MLTTQLFKTTTFPGMNLASLNIQHELPPNLEELLLVLISNENDVRFLQNYGSLDTLDLWVGGLVFFWLVYTVTTHTATQICCCTCVLTLSDHYKKFITAIHLQFLFPSGLPGNCIILV